MKAKLLVVCALVILAGAGCKKNVDDPNDETEHEAINSVVLTFKQNGVAAGVFRMEDPDGDGGNPPTRIDPIVLQANKTYTLEITLQNISGSTTKDITETIRAEGKHHEFYFITSGVTVNITKTDKDANNYPLGFNSTWLTTSAANGTVRLKLMHKPFIKGANDAPTIGHSDIDVSIPLNIN